MYSSLRTRLRSLVCPRQSNRVRAVWRVLVPILAGYLALQLSGATALAVDVSEGTRMLVATAFAVARSAGALRVTGTASIPDAATFGRLLAFLVAFVGVAFYEEFVYRGGFLTNAIEGLSDRGYARPVAPIVALVASSVAFALVHLPSAIAAAMVR